MSERSGFIRNIAFVGHNGAGKTTFAEHALAGSVAHELEQALGRSADACSGKVREVRSPYQDRAVRLAPLGLGQADAREFGQRVDPGGDQLRPRAGIQAERVAHRGSPLIHRSGRERGWPAHIARRVDVRYGRAAERVDGQDAYAVDEDGNIYALNLSARTLALWVNGADTCQFDGCGTKSGQHTAQPPALE